MISLNDLKCERTTEGTMRIGTQIVAAAVADFAITTSTLEESDTMSPINLNDAPSSSSHTSSQSDLSRLCKSKKIEVEKEVVDPWSYHFNTPKDFLVLYNLAGILPKEKDKEKEKDSHNEKEKEKNKEKIALNDKKNEKTTANVDKQIVFSFFLSLNAIFSLFFSFSFSL